MNHRSDTFFNFFDVFLVFDSFSGCGYWLMNDNPHQTRTAAEKCIRKSFFIVHKRQRHNWNLMFNRQSESTIFEFIQNDRFIIRNTAFGKNANAQSFTHVSGWDGGKCATSKLALRACILTGFLEHGAVQLEADVRHVLHDMKTTKRRQHDNPVSFAICSCLFARICLAILFRRSAEPFFWAVLLGLLIIGFRQVRDRLHGHI